MRGFLSDIYLRPSCYECKCKNGVNHSDLTIGDYWAARVTDQDFDDDKGVGLVLVNTSKGKECFDGLDMIVRVSTLEKAHLCNGGFNEHTSPHPKRDKFYRLIQDGCSVTNAVEQCLKVSLVQLCLKRAKGLARRILKKILSYPLAVSK